jgi:hypothetical protein
MANFDDDGRGRYKQLFGALAALSGLLGIAVTAIVVAGGAQLVSSPMATAGTTRATPWVPRPAFLGRPAPHPSTSVSAQGSKADKEALAFGNWVNKGAGDAFGAISDAMTALGKALNNQDQAAVRKYCIQLQNAGEKYAKVLPTPIEEATAASETAVNEIAAASAACLADPPDIEGLTTHATEANKQLAVVAKIGSGG